VRSKVGVGEQALDDHLCTGVLMRFEEKIPPILRCV
jgi:hypothetical protein